VGRTPNSRRGIFVGGLTVAYAALLAFTIAHHEMWRDEMQAWLLARDSRSIGELLGHLRYEGHPALWYVCLFPLARITANPAVMQGLHAAIAIAAVWVMARYAPFTPIQKGLLAFGYFFLFEYAAVSRSYVLGVLLTFICCELFRRRRPLALGLALALLAQTSVFGIIIGAAFAAAVGVAGTRWSTGDGPASGIRTSFWLPIACFGLGAFAAVAVAWPAPDSGYAVGWYTILDRERAIFVATALPEVIFPRLARSPYWWAREFPLLPGPWGLYELAALGVMVWVWLRLARSRPALAFSVVATVGLLAFFYLKLPDGLNKHGHLFLALVAALWLGVPSGATGLGNRAADATLSFIVAWHAVVGLRAAQLEYRTRFSAAKAVATYLEQNWLVQAPLLAMEDYTAAGVLGYARKAEAYYPRGRRFGSFVVWDTARIRPVSDSAVMAETRQLARSRHETTLVLFNVMPRHAGVVDSLTRRFPGLDLMATFLESTVGDEGFALFRARTIVDGNKPPRRVAPPRRTAPGGTRSSGPG